LKCINENACIGGSGLVSLTSNYSGEENNILCSPGYGGNLCASCAYVNGTRYEMFGTNECRKCPPKWLNGLEISGIFIALFIAFSVLLYINIKST
jgi:hypothetical protein